MPAGAGAGWEVLSGTQAATAGLGHTARLLQQKFTPQERQRAGRFAN